VAIDYTSPKGKVRLLLADLDEARPVLTDGELDGYLALHDGAPSQIRRAAADALDAIATSETLVSKVMRTADGTTTDGAKLADSLRKRAETLRAQADDEDDDAAWGDGEGPVGVSEFSPYPRWP